MVNLTINNKKISGTGRYYDSGAAAQAGNPRFQTCVI